MNDVNASVGQSQYKFADLKKPPTKPPQTQTTHIPIISSYVHWHKFIPVIRISLLSTSYHFPVFPVV